MSKSIQSLFPNYQPINPSTLDYNNTNPNYSSLNNTDYEALWNTEADYGYFGNNQSSPYQPITTSPLALNSSYEDLLPNPDTAGSGTGTGYDPTDDTNKTAGIKWLGKDGVLIPGLNALSGITKAITGLEQIGLNKEAFAFNKNLTNKNFANQAQITNNAIYDRGRAGAVQRGENTNALDTVATNLANKRRVSGVL